VSCTDTFKSQHDLAYDPQLYQRDRGELDWDQRSIATTTVFDNASFMPGGRPPSLFYADGRTGTPAPGYTPPIPGYNTYLNQGPSEIELTNLEEQQRPLLHQPSQGSGFFDGNQPGARQTMHSSSTSMPQNLQQNFNDGGGYREAPIHRPYPSNHAPSTYSGYSDGQAPQQYPPRPGPTPAPSYNAAGRGAYQGGY
jgi:hypothetical protein